MTWAVSFSAKNPAKRSAMLRVTEMTGFSDSSYPRLMEKMDCITLLESRNSRQDSLQAASLWRVTLVPALLGC